MTIEKNRTATELEVNVIGRLDTTTAPQLEAALKESFEGLTKLVLDFTALDYLSSAGLRVILMAQKTMIKQGEMIIRNANEMVRDVFDVTGMIDILTLE